MMYYPIFYFYANCPILNGEDRIRWYADTRRQAQVAAAKLDWLEAHLPGDYTLSTIAIRHSQREGSTPLLDQQMVNIFGTTADPYAHVVYAQINDPAAQWLFEDGTKEIY